MSDPRPTDPFETLLGRLPLLWASLAFVGGLLLASRFDLPAWLWTGLAALAAGLAALARRLLPRRGGPLLGLQPGGWFLLLVCLAGLFAGAARYRLAQPVRDAGFIAWYNDREYEVLVTGTLVEPPDERDAYANLRLRVASVDTGDQSLPVEGLLLARLDPGSGLRYGDVVRLRGHLQTPPEGEGFSYREYLERQGIHAYMPDAQATRLPFQGGNPFLEVLYTFKERCLGVIHDLFPDPEASLLAGILLGQDNGLPAGLQQDFKDTGTSHIIAISGFNIAILAGLFVTVFGRLLGRRRGALAAAAGILVYTLLVGAEASVVRAAIMGGLALFARQIGRRQTALNTLAFTAAVMGLIDPFTPWDVGFQLSFFATLGLVLYAEPFQAWAVARLARRLPLEKARRIAAPLAEYVFFTLAAQLTTLPIMAWHFRRLSLVALVANPFILPVQPAVMILGGLAVLLGLAWAPIGQVAAWVAWPFPAYTIRAVELFAGLPHGVIVLGDFSFLLVLLFYALLLGWTFSRGRLKQALRLAARPAALLTVLGALSFVVWRAALSAPDGRLHLTFLEVGSADAVLVQTPGGGNLLLNGGPSPSLLSDGLGRRLPPFGPGLDWLVVASPQEAQLAALPRLVERYPPGQVLWAGNRSASYPAEDLVRRLLDLGLTVTTALPGSRLDLGAGARLTALAVTPRGAVLLVEYGGFRALLPIGASFEALEALDGGREVGQVTVLLLADSGYGPLNPPDWLAALRPQVAVLSVAAGDPAGLPDPDVLAALAGTTLLRTDRDGWIEVTSDGSGLWLEVERK